MKNSGDIFHYFPSNVPVTQQMWERLALIHMLAELPSGRRLPEIIFVRHLAESLNRLPERSGRSVPAGLINLYGMQQRIFRYLIKRYTDEQQPDALAAAARKADHPFSAPAIH